MGVLFDYFRAPDAAAAQAMELPAGPLVPSDAGLSVFDGVATKGVDPAVVLGQLVAVVREVPWTTDVVRTESVWPPPETAPATAEQAAELPEDSPWSTGPWVEELDNQTRNTLADVNDNQSVEIAERWARIEEFGGYGDIDTDELRVLVTELTGLARRARDAGDRLYCWCSL